jgi:hypothetical protein
MLIRTPGFTIFTTESIARFMEISENIRGLVTIINYSISISLIVVLIIQGIELAKAMYGLSKMNYKTK